MGVAACPRGAIRLRRRLPVLASSRYNDIYLSSILPWSPAGGEASCFRCLRASKPALLLRNLNCKPAALQHWPHQGICVNLRWRSTPDRRDTGSAQERPRVSNHALSPAVPWWGFSFRSSRVETGVPAIGHRIAHVRSKITHINSAHATKPIKMGRQLSFIVVGPPLSHPTRTWAGAAPQIVRVGWPFAVLQCQSDVKISLRISINLRRFSSIASYPLLLTLMSG